MTGAAGTEEDGATTTGGAAPWGVWKRPEGPMKILSASPPLQKQAQYGSKNLFGVFIVTNNLTLKALGCIMGLVFGG